LEEAKAAQPEGGTRVLSYVQAREMLAALDGGAGDVETSLDLGRNRVRLALPHELPLTAEELRGIAKDEAVCYRIGPKGAEKVQRFVGTTNSFYKLVPTAEAPTIEISGIRMHRTKEMTPWPDTVAKLAAIKPLVGRVLDTTTGLGYTAILASRTAQHVLTIERDAGVVAIAEQNPWSRELFDNPRIERRMGDSAEVVPTLPAGSFDRVVHDPPTMALAGELYGLAF
jgi:uncharacterized protein